MTNLLWLLIRRMSNPAALCVWTLHSSSIMLRIWYTFLQPLVPPSCWYLPILYPSADPVCSNDPCICRSLVLVAAPASFILHDNEYQVEHVQTLHNQWFAS